MQILTLEGKWTRIIANIFGKLELIGLNGHLIWNTKLKWEADEYPKIMSPVAQIPFYGVPDWKFRAVRVKV